MLGIFWYQIDYIGGVWGDREDCINRVPRACAAHEILEVK